jgi:YVTN family beta-propeller protein
LCVGAGLAALCFFVGKSDAQATPQRALLALSKRDHTLAIIDPDSLKVIARAPVGPDPHEVIASSDGRTAYVSIYGFGRYHQISVIDLNTQKALPDIDTGALLGPHGLAFVGGKLWFTAEAAKAIARYDPTSGKIDWIMGTGQNRTHMIYVRSDENEIYTTNVNSATVSIFDQIVPPPPVSSQLKKDWNDNVVPVGKGDEGFDVSPDGRELWTADALDGTLSIIDIASRKVTATLDAKLVSASRLKFTPDGRYVMISTLRNGDLMVYDVAARKEFKRIPVGTGAAGILMDPIRSRVFVSCSPDNYVAVVDLNTYKVIGHIDVGAQPDGLAWAQRP